MPVYIALISLYTLNHFSENSNMALKQEKLKRCVWYAVFIALLVITITQLMQSFDSWEERPFDTLVDKVPKQNIPYPSVTVCPAGWTFIFLLPLPPNIFYITALY